MISTTLPSHVQFIQSSRFQYFYDLFKPNEQDKKFSRILLILLAVYFVIAIVVPFLTQVEVQREAKEQLPVHLAKIILKEKQLPIIEKKIIEKKIPEDKKPEVKDDVEKEKEKPKTPKTKREVAKQKATTSGLAAMKDELFAMRDSFEIKPNATPLNAQKTTETKIKRKLLAAQTNKQSSILAAENISRTVVSDELSTRNTQQIRLSEEEVLAGEDVLVEQQLNETNSRVRSEMSLRRALEAHKSRLYARYNRALRKDPFLQGKVLFEIEIQPNGKVTKVSIKSSELNNSKLDKQLMAILRSIRFSKENVEVMVTIWAIDFLPS